MFRIGTFGPATLQGRWPGLSANFEAMAWVDTPLARAKLPGFGCLLAVSCAVASGGCSPLEENLFSPQPDDYQSSQGANGSGGAGASGSTGGAGASSVQGDLPCEVSAVLAAHCDACHAASIPPLLRNRAELMAASSSDPSKSNAEVSVERMQNAASPMPPDGIPPAADALVLADWITAGYPEGDCGGGTGGSGGASFLPDYDTPVTCTSGQTWNNGDNDGAQMYPGRACNECHANEKPDEIYDFAGTVYPSAHEPDDCLGAQGAIVELTDANGAITTATTNVSGNFRVEGSFAYPVKVRIVANGQQLPMVTPLGQGDGDCNTCHDEAGSDNAPGRIIMPN